VPSPRPASGSRRRLLSGLVAVGTIGTVGPLVGCVRPAAPAPAISRDTAPPWDAPRDAVSYIEAARLRAEPLGTGGNVQTVQLTVTVAGSPVAVPAFVGVDRVRDLQAPAHTHDPGGLVWLEGSGRADVTLGQLFVLWGVRFGPDCLGAACGSVRVLADGEPVTDPVALSLRGVRSAVVVTA